MLKNRFRLISSLSILAMLSLLTQPPAEAAKQVLSGEVCSEKVHQLMSDLTWYKNLNKAEDAANRDGKLIVWVHMLGKIDGST